MYMKDNQTKQEKLWPEEHKDADSPTHVMTPL